MDKGILKYNEATSITKTYEVIVKKLKEERVVYDKQLSNLSTQLKEKSIEVDNMLLMSHDANNARKKSEQDLRDEQQKIQNMRQERILQIQEQKMKVEDRVGQTRKDHNSMQKENVRESPSIQAYKGSKDKNRLE